MERLWAPWRLEYVAGDATDEPLNVAPEDLLPGGQIDCFLCRAAVEPSDDRSRDRHNLVIARGQHDVVVLNRYPYNNGHLLVAPRLHVGRFDEVAREVHADMLDSITRLVQLLERLMRAQGFNVGLNLGQVGGAGLPGHLHWHVVPRWGGDTNFMPALANTRVIPQSLDELWEVMVDALEERS
jgi:ATP adenylyltransferase